MIPIARWQTKKGKNYLELFKDYWGYIYKGNNCGGVLPKLSSDKEAIEYMENNAVKTLRMDLQIFRKEDENDIKTNSENN